ncbi:MAG: hypothetical protein LBH40_05835 [Alphaproteobacteria bacterium]|jgi:hypothetical protein|nr:hypothetical protein [Alphaproteobacteria bacterium]
MAKKKSIFSIKLVRSLFLVIMLKIVGFTVLFFLFFSPEHRIEVTPNVITDDVFHIKTESQQE